MLVFPTTNKFVEKEPHFEQSAMGVHEFVVHHPAHGRFVHFDVIGDVAKVQRLQEVHAVIEELALVPDDALHHAIDRSLTLVDGLDQPHC